MTNLAGAPIVVGVDGSDSAHVALTLAARTAASRHRPLRIVHAFVWPLLHVPLGPAAEAPDGGLLNDATRVIDEAVSFARRHHPGLEVTGEVVVGAPAAVLLGEAAQAAVIVLGSRGLGGFTGMLVGSVAVQVSAHAACPVLVARGEQHADRDVLVGVDGSPTGAAALGFAFEEASLRGVGLTVLHAYVHPVAGDPGDMLPLVYDSQQLFEDESIVTAEVLAGWRDKFPDVRVNTVVVRKQAARALVEASHDAGLVVVGSRGRGGFAGLLLGSVSQALLHHADCPVAIIH